MTIAINKNLIECSEFNPTRDSLCKTIKELCIEIDKNEIVLPLFQTAERWSIDKCIELFNFQLLGKAPVSPLSMNLIKDKNNAVKQISFLTRSSVDDIKGCYSVNDGQQRTLTNYKAFKNNPDFHNIVLDITLGKFILIKESIKDYQIPVGILYNELYSNFSNYTNNNSILKDGDVKDLLLQVRSKFFNYTYTVNIAKDMTKDEQTKWFSVLNVAGSKVPAVQLKFATLLEDGIDIHVEYINKFKYILKSYGYDNTIFVKQQAQFSTPVAALNPAYEIITNSPHNNNLSPISSDAKPEKICKLDSHQIKKCFNLTLNALNKSLEFIDENNLPKASRIEYITFLLGLFVYIDNKDLNNSQKERLIQWYKNINFDNAGNTKRRAIFNDVLNLKFV